MKMSSKGRTELEICLSGPKLHEEADFDVQKCLAPPKSSQKRKKLISEAKNPVKNFFGRQKMKCGELSETCFGKV